MVEGGGFEPPKLARQIYSLIPLATREPLRKAAHSADEVCGSQQICMANQLLTFIDRRPVLTGFHTCLPGGAFD